jgi:hypothetical protein
VGAVVMVQGEMVAAAAVQEYQLQHQILEEREQQTEVMMAEILFIAQLLICAQQVVEVVLAVQVLMELLVKVAMVEMVLLQA